MKAPIARRGHSKRKGNDLRICGLGLRFSQKNRRYHLVAPAEEGALPTGQLRLSPRLSGKAARRHPVLLPRKRARHPVLLAPARWRPRPHGRPAHGPRGRPCGGFAHERPGAAIKPRRHRRYALGLRRRARSAWSAPHHRSCSPTWTPPSVASRSYSVSRPTPPSAEPDRRLGHAGRRHINHHLPGHTAPRRETARKVASSRPSKRRAAPQRRCSPAIAREMMRRWISEVPSKIV